MKKATLTITGMHCASCGSNIEKSLSQIKGVHNIRINVIAKKGFLDCDDTVREEDLKKAVKRVGYTVETVTIE